MLFAFWSQITEAQAILLSGILTLLAAVAGIYLGWWLFSGRVKDLESALAESQNIINSFGNSTREELSKLRNEIETLTIQAQASAKSIGEIGGSVTDLVEKSDVSAGIDDDDPKAKLRRLWESIREIIETIASDKNIDGRTAAKYQRVDRRNYSDLVWHLSNDGRLKGHDSEINEAVDIWKKYRTGRATPTQDDVVKMQTLLSALSRSFASS
jgi:polyribonucleotide nucleotidyltransferase